MRPPPAPRLNPALAAHRPAFARPAPDRGDYQRMSYSGEEFQLRMGGYAGQAARTRLGKVLFARSVIWNWLFLAKDVDLRREYAQSASRAARRLWPTRHEEEQFALLLGAEAMRLYPHGRLLPFNEGVLAAEVAAALRSLGRRSGALCFFASHRLALAQVAELCRGRRVLFVFPTDGDVRLLFAAAGADPLQLPWGDPSAALDWPALEVRIDAAAPAALFVANPATPTGAALPAAELLRLGALCLRRGMTLIADESDKDGGLPHAQFTSFAAEGLAGQLDGLPLLVLEHSLQFFLTDVPGAACTLSLHGFEAETQRQMAVRARLYAPSVPAALYLLCQCRWLRRAPPLSTLFAPLAARLAARLDGVRLTLYLKQLSARKQLAGLPGLRVAPPRDGFALVLEFVDAAERLPGAGAVDARLCALLHEKLKLVAVPGSHFGLDARRGFVLLSSANVSYAYNQQLTERLKRFARALADDRLADLRPLAE